MKIKYFRLQIIAFILFVSLCARADMTPAQINRFADCVYQIEGGNKTQFPYGVKSIKYTKTVNKLIKKEWARAITINSIKNNYARWTQSGKTNSFQNFFADKWCPAQCDPGGNRNWKKNINVMFPDKIN